MRQLGRVGERFVKFSMAVNVVLVFFERTSWVFNL